MTGITEVCPRSVESFTRGEVVPVASALDAYDELVAAGDPEPPVGRFRPVAILVSGGG